MTPKRHGDVVEAVRRFGDSGTQMNFIVRYDTQVSMWPSGGDVDNPTENGLLYGDKGR
jgi:hypothetical protein